jgi:hypothetical protein
VVYANARSVRESCSDRGGERLVAGRSELPWVEGRQPPILAVRVELVRGGADSHVAREHVLPEPGVGAVRIDPDGEVVDERYLAVRRLELDVEEPLHPLMEANAIGVIRAPARHCRIVRVRVLRRPRRRSAVVPLVQRHIRGEVLERGALRAYVRLEIRGPSIRLPDRLERP